MQEIKHHSEEAQLEILSINPATAIDCSEALQCAAVRKDPNAIQRIFEPCEAAKLIAVKQMPMLITSLKDPSERLQITALEHDPWILLMIDAPTPRAITTALEKIAGVPFTGRKNLAESTKLKAIQAEWRLLEYIKDADEKLQMCALQQNVSALELIDSPSEEMMKIGAQSLWGASYMILSCNHHFNLSSAVKGLAAKTLLKAFLSGQIMPFDEEYRHAYLSVASESEILDFLHDSNLGAHVAICDFQTEPTDRIKEFFIEQFGLDYYLAEAPDDWSLRL